MAITTLDGVLAGMQAPHFITKAATPTLTAGRPHSLAYLAGTPGLFTASGGVNGANLESTSAQVAGQIPYADPVSGNAYLARFAANCTQPGTLLLCDRLWHNTGLSVTSTSFQAITQPTLPARDAAGGTTGIGVLVGLEVQTATSTGSPTITLQYTNTASATGRNATNTVATSASAPAGAFFPIGLQAGDLGVKAVEGVTLSATWTSGAIGLVAYRVLASLDVMSAGFGTSVDAITGGFPRMYNGSVPFLIFIPSNTNASTVFANLAYSHG